MSVTVAIEIDGRAVDVEAGRPLGAILHHEAHGVLRHTAKSGAPRGLFCGMGLCFDCLVTVDGRRDVRACMIAVQAGMRVETRRK